METIIDYLYKSILFYSQKERLEVNSEFELLLDILYYISLQENLSNYN